MNIAALGLLSGFAKGTSERIDQEREEEKTLINNRLRMAAANKLKREEENKAKKEAAMERKGQIDSLFPGASLEQQLALMSNDTIFNTAVKNASTLQEEGKLDSFIVVNKDKIPANFKTVQDYVDSLLAVPKEAKMPEMPDKEVFFAKTSPTQAQMESLASQYGGTAAELLAYENLPSAEMAPIIGSMNLEVLKSPKDLDEQIKDIDMKAADPNISAEERTALNERKTFLIAQQNYGQEPSTLQEEANRISLKLLKATGAEAAALKEQLNKVNNQIRSNAAAQEQEKDRADKFGDKPLTYSEIRKMVESAQVAALESAKGLDAVTKGKLVEEYTDEDGEKRIRIRKLKATDLPEIASIARKAAISALRINGHIDEKGNMTRYARGVLTGLGLLDEQGRIIPDPLASQGQQNTENEANRQRGNTPAPTTPQGQKTATMDQVRAIAEKRGKSPAEIKKDMEANGYVITGE